MYAQLATYNESDRTRYMSVIAHLANVDGQLTSEEIFALRQMCIQFVLGPEARGKVFASTTLSDTEFNALVASLTNTELRYSLLVDLWSVALSDGSVHAAEETEIEQASNLLGISAEHLTAIKKFAEALQRARGGEAGKARAAVESALGNLESAGVQRSSLGMSAALWGTTSVTADR